MPINNQKEFFENIKLDDDGNVIITIVTKVEPNIETNNQYDVFRQINLTEDGSLSVYKI